MNRKITLVGAGPGDPELLTVKGLRAIKNANAILYDALVNPDLLKNASPNAKLVCVGKRAGKHSFKQDEIQLLLVRYAYEYGHVVRLKGGDPFVFGRGYEELEYARAFDIDVEVVPGISSAIAVPASQNIPVTCRNVSESFWVLTATTKSGKLSDDIALAAQSTATLVILMGMRKLPDITRIFRDLNKSSMPVLVIQNGTLPNEKVAVGTMDDIESRVAEAKMGTPALIVVGYTVTLHPAFIEKVKSAIA